MMSGGVFVCCILCIRDYVECFTHVECYSNGTKGRLFVVKSMSDVLVDSV